MSYQRSLEQKRAEHAWNAVSKASNGQAGWAKEYGQLARGAPADIMISGLGQTMAFWRAKGYDNGRPKGNGQNAHYQLLEHLSDWLKKRFHTAESGDVVEWIVQKASVAEYRRASAEALAYLTWLKRFAEAELGGQ